MFGQVKQSGSLRFPISICAQTIEGHGYIQLKGVFGALQNWIGSEQFDLLLVETKQTKLSSGRIWQKLNMGSELIAWQRDLQT